MNIKEILEKEAKNISEQNNEILSNENGISLAILIC